jgi:hypothetical protein
MLLVSMVAPALCRVPPTQGGVRSKPGIVNPSRPGRLINQPAGPPACRAEPPGARLVCDPNRALTSRLVRRKIVLLNTSRFEVTAAAKAVAAG